MKNHKKLFIILSPLLCFLAVWGFSLAKCEILSIKYGEEFSEIYKENTMIGEQQHWKVLEYSDKYARVYYIGRNNSSANVLKFKNVNGVWKYTGQWDTVWSKSGNADGFVWPYFWHCFYALRNTNY